MAKPTLSCRVPLTGAQSPPNRPIKAKTLRKNQIKKARRERLALQHSAVGAPSGPLGRDARRVQRKAEESRAKIERARKSYESALAGYGPAIPATTKTFPWMKEAAHREAELAEARRRSHLKRAGYTEKRQEKLMLAFPSWVDVAQIDKIYERSAGLTRSTGIQHHVDHIVPIQHDAVCGLHVAANLQAIPALDNLRKGNRFTTG